MKIHIDWMSGSVLVTEGLKSHNMRFELNPSTMQKAILEKMRGLGYIDARVWNDTKNLLDFMERSRSSRHPKFEKPFGEFVFTVQAGGISNKPLSTWPTVEEIEARNAAYQEKSEQE